MEKNTDVFQVLIPLIKRGCLIEIARFYSQQEHPLINSQGWNPLFFTAAFGNLETFKYFLSLEYSLEAEDKNQRTVFDVASGAKNQEIVNYLYTVFPHAFHSEKYIRYYSLSTQEAYSLLESLKNGKPDSGLDAFLFERIRI